MMDSKGILVYDNTIVLKSVVDTGYNIIPIAVAHITQLEENKNPFLLSIVNTENLNNG